MKLMISIIFVITAGLSAVGWKYAQPHLTAVGTSVITVAGGSNGESFTVKLPQDLPRPQQELLTFAYDTARADGYKQPQLLQGVILQESRAGAIQNFRVAGLTNKVGDRYFGIGQIKLAAAKEVLKSWPELWKTFDTRTDEELQAKLILDDKFNIKVASKYLMLMGVNSDPITAITAYNKGPAGVKTVNPHEHDYTLKVRGHVSNLKNIPQKQGEIRFTHLARQ